MSSTSVSPLIVAFVSDLSFASLIDAVAEHGGYQVHWIEAETDLIQLLGQGVQNQGIAQDMTDYDTLLLDKLSRLHPALILVDLDNSKVPWHRWLGLIKTSPATLRIPVLCFGAHKETTAIQTARNLGADVVVSRSRFVKTLPELIHKYARRQDYNDLEAACHQPLTDLAIQGLEEFNQRKYFEAHETLEEAWRLDQTTGRDFYRAVLQVAVAYLQIERRNYRGAIKMFLRLRQWLDPLPDICRGVDLAQLRIDVEKVYTTLVALGERRIEEFDQRLFRPIRYKS